MPDRERIILRIGSEQNCILIKLSQYKGRKILDIRRHYLDESSGKLLPTRKGITLTQQQAEAFFETFLENKDLVKEWFNEDSTTTDLVKKNVSGQIQAKEEAKHGFKLYERDIYSGAVSSFFHIESNGGREKISYNSKHPIHSIISDTKDRIMNTPDPSSTVGKDIEVILFLVDVILLSYFRAKTQFDKSQLIDPDTFIETLEINWSATLKRYIKELEHMVL